jgi:lipopolysaccharide/colanic/teichoic acid biosynthesis glycosyltransferase
MAVRRVPSKNLLAEWQSRYMYDCTGWMACSKDSMGKRLFDIAAAAAGLLLLSPLFAFIALHIRREDGGPVFYRGDRVGRHGRLFQIYKFRTMFVNAEKAGVSSTSEDDPRITRIGKSLRKYKLDELPQLINVLSGEMSLVGPRPQVKWAVDRYSDDEREILTVRPGITDYASLHFSNEGEILKGSKNPDQDYLEKIHPLKTRLALKYVRNHSMLMDIKIILKTITVVAKKQEADDRK